jgi:hypothetical protein
MKSFYHKILRLGIGITVVSIALYMVVNQGWNTGEWDIIGSHWIALFGWIFTFGISAVYFFNSEQDMIRNIVYSSFIGISISSMLQYMYNNNIIFDEVLIDVALWELQFAVILVWALVGIIVGAARR